MAESEIPRDIERAAVELWQRCLDERDADHVEIIAQALLAERERCARVASKLSQLDKPHLIPVAVREPWKFDKMVEFYEVPAIRQDNPNETEQGNG